MRFSVIVPIYNVEKHIHQCVQSVLSQTFKDFELILVDDGSPDKCPDICDEYAHKDSRVKVLHKKNGGLVSARKAGAKAAHGDYCIAVDGDDWIDIDTLNNINKVIEETHPDVVRFGSILATSKEDFKVSKSTKFRKGYYSRKDIENEIIPWLIYGKNGISFPHSVWGNAIIRSLYVQEQQEVPDKIMIGEDASVMHPIYYKAQSIFLMKESLYYYRVNPSSMTKNKKPFLLENPRWRAEHLNNRMDLTKYDLQAQLDCSTVHSLFNACLTQFWQKKTYCNVKSDILAALNDSLYSQVIRRVKYDSPFSRKIMTFIMRYRLVCCLWLYSKVKKF